MADVDWDKFLPPEPPAGAPQQVAPGRTQPGPLTSPPPATAAPATPPPTWSQDLARWGEIYGAHALAPVLGFPRELAPRLGLAPDLGPFGPLPSEAEVRGWAPTPASTFERSLATAGDVTGRVALPVAGAGALMVGAGMAPELALGTGAAMALGAGAGAGATEARRELYPLAEPYSELADIALGGIAGGGVGGMVGGGAGGAVAGARGGFIRGAIGTGIAEGSEWVARNILNLPPGLSQLVSIPVGAAVGARGGGTPGQRIGALSGAGAGLLSGPPPGAGPVGTPLAPLGP